MTKTAASKDTELRDRIKQRTGVALSTDDARTLRRAAQTLHRWSELECGDGNEYSSWAIERDEETGIPYMCTYPHKGTTRREKIADREKGALRRVKEVCERNGLHFYHQGDPRGAALYVSDKTLTNQSYSDGVACY